MNNNKKIGIALGGGGARGLAHLGVLKILKKEGIEIDLVIGTSMGAFMGACFCLGLDMDELIKEAVSFNKRKAVKELLDISPPTKSLIKGKKVEKYINKILQDKDFSDLKIPLYVDATNLASGEEVLLHKGNLAKAVMASISVPGIFPPVKYGEDYLVDGGVVNPTPIDRVEEKGADIVIGVDLMVKDKVRLNNPGIVSTLLQSYEIIRAQSVNFCLRRQNQTAIIIKPGLRSLSDSFKFYNIEKFIEAGEEATKEALPEIRRRLGV